MAFDAVMSLVPVLPQLAGLFTISQTGIRSCTRTATPQNSSFIHNTSKAFPLLVIPRQANVPFTEHACPVAFGAQHFRECEGAGRSEIRHAQDFLKG